MQNNRIFNFNPGPATLPLPVLEEIQESFLNFEGSGMSVTEVSHRSKEFDGIINEAIARTKKLMNLGDDFEVLFIQGGASLQFYMIPTNFLTDDRTADYINTGTWSTKAIKEAQIIGKKIQTTASSEDKNFSYIPKNISVSDNATYVHLTSNNTIKGTQFSEFPDTNGIPIIADMSSDILCRPVDPSAFGLIYAGAQKNMGPAGVCMVIIRKDMLKLIPENLPSMLNYLTYVSKNSLYNTPPCFAIYTVHLVLKWLDETIGGVKKMEDLNNEKANLVYDILDKSDFYNGTAEKESRSLMNITFRLPSDDLEKKFVADASKNGLAGLKGHRSVGGCRASIYNAMPLAGVKALAEFMEEFERTNG